MATVIEIAAPPEVPRSASRSLAMLVPGVMSVFTAGLTVAALAAGSPAVRSPTAVAFPVMMVASVVMTALAGRGRRRGAAINAERADYLEYLCGLRARVTEIAAAQHYSLMGTAADPDMLWTLVGGPRMWARQPDDLARLQVRVGVGAQPLAASLVAAPIPAPTRCDPVTVAALRRFLRTHSTIADAPIMIPLGGRVTIDGDPTQVRGLIRAMVCQLTVAHAPGLVSVTAVVSPETRAHWDWLKWLPHFRYRREPVLVVADGVDVPDGQIPGTTVLAVGGGGTSVAVRQAGAQWVLSAPDWLDPDEALVCARRLAAHGDVAVRAEPLSPLGIGDISHYDPIALWRNQVPCERLRVPIGAGADGRVVELDIKEAAEHGMGPHGLCVGATGSGKSELLRTIALGMMARNSPDVLNLLLVDFKGGATFLDLARAPHVAAVITNLADDAPLVARMRDALAGEMNRRQQLLRTAGNLVSAAAYERGRGSGSPALPALFIIVDEFSELLSQQPDFADTFVAIGRLGRSLGMHLLLASQRLDEGRLRGLEAHLSYRICLKTLSASESRTVLGVLDAYELPNVPGAGLLRDASGRLVRFQAAYVSGPVITRPVDSGAPAVRRFTAVDHRDDASGAAELGLPLMHTLLDRLAGQGPCAHRVWLPPLDDAPRLSSLLGAQVPLDLSVPIGLVDRPYHQDHTPLMVDLSGAAGNVAVVGAPRSGKSTALCTLIGALAATQDPARVHFYCIDLGGGALSTLRELPHVGSVADRTQPELIRRMVAEVELTVRNRAARNVEPCADVFLVIDGWSVLRHEFESVIGGAEERISNIAAQGLSAGVHVVVSATRWAEIRPALKDQIGTRIELRLGDPADSELDRKAARAVPRGRPGRGICGDGSHMMVALPTLDVLAVRRGAGTAPPVPVLPAVIDYDAVVCGGPAGAMLLGVGENGLHSIAVDFNRHLHLLVLGDRGCGKSTVLRTLCREVVRSRTSEQAQVFVIDFRRTLLGAVAPEHLAGYVSSPTALGALLPGLISSLRERMRAADFIEAQHGAGGRWTGPEFFLVVDDYDLVAAIAGNPLAALLEYLPYAVDLGLHVLVARRAGGAARALFEPLLAGLRDFGCVGLMMSGRPDEGVLLGCCPPAPLPPGRGILIADGVAEQHVQVAWSPSA